MKILTKLTVCLVLSAAAAFGAGTYVGAGAGYWIDSEDMVFNARVGFDVAQQGNLTHAIELEGYSGEDDEGRGIKLRLAGALVNYRLTVDLNAPLYVSFGAGLGATRAKLRGYWYAGTDNAFTYQAIATLGYRITPQFSVEASARYLNIGKVDFSREKIGDDVSAELGVKYHF
ncbi:outer membrane beta-barrel protein [Opitutus sp. ER46]|uniref:outer membrane beta-barrel protein n=1 Tax=Opitutus sp. ER46 TaxID=2161864 RepID=UPI000D3087BD|nr:outer membrane beta-barrel protein [Opitutus sp. ER46]PTX98413.1 hypothetical protein DB354_03855 [Opitutus sp. ER46]